MKYYVIGDTSIILLYAIAIEQNHVQFFIVVFDFFTFLGSFYCLFGEQFKLVHVEDSSAQRVYDMLHFLY